MANFEKFDAFIEIPTGSRNKYEFDFELKKMRFDRLLFSSMMYPADYGFIPETLALDNDPLDVLVLVTEPMIPGLIVEVKPVGVFYMSDDKGQDEKIICVPTGDPIMNKLNDLKDVNEHKLLEIEHFFQVYKDLEKKKVETNGFGDKAAAIALIEECQARFNALDAEKQASFAI
ncbi:inorganic diphosphatase [Paenimyroides tangerinum]|uniref:Inorganic pyrophosphatase n=1 Tax=Paenimyroides tangerinum TaxID=2488728 RepID=A0A3P3W5E0_9FLAO|nr:inorganic diphosphatase [Paenimyroides tangerinum]RRJ89894.1 inorganic diphosphatase [Paenimyroides tangerinum]